MLDDQEMESQQTRVVRDYHPKRGERTLSDRKRTVCVCVCVQPVTLPGACMLCTVSSVIDTSELVCMDV